MQLKCVSDYRSGSMEFKKGQDVHVADEVGEFLLRDSPGSFRPMREKQVEDVTEETASGVSAPDRRGRGGLQR